MVEFAGWSLPQQYSSVRDEHRAVREGTGVFDVSHMGRLLVSGPGTPEFLQRMLTNDVGRLGSRRCQYTLLCSASGGIIDDLIVGRGEEAADPWWVVVNAANRERDLAWLRDHAPAGVEVRDRTEETALLAVQGPAAASLLRSQGLDLEELRSFAWREAELAGIPITVSRTGYTGEDGFELTVGSAQAVCLWDMLCEHGAVPCGLAARDVCRLEAALRLYGSDMDDATDPFEVGLGWVVKLEKGEFEGSDALRERRGGGSRRKMIGVLGSRRVIPRHGQLLSRNGAAVGFVTSGTFSFSLDRGVGLALVEADAAESPDPLIVTQRGGGDAVTVDPTGLPFYRRQPRQTPV
jgi:aminomethyltransferase